MKLSTVYAKLSLLALPATAHYTFPSLIVNGTVTEQWKYVRKVVPRYPQDNLGYERAWPHEDIYNANLTCGRSAFLSASTTFTADVMAGEEVGFRVANNDIEEYTPSIYHQGPAQAYLTKPQNDTPLESFNGIDADWFKIASITAKDDGTWATYEKTTVNFTIPAKTPPGRYLLRFEQIYPGPSFNQTQIFLNCAHINVIGPGGGDLTGYQFAKFPGTYDLMDPGLWLGGDFSQGRNLLRYVAPGPAVWKG